MSVSPRQRAKVKGMGCIVCLAEPVDPSHLCDASLGGCLEPECVVPLCRTHHRFFDEGGLDLLPYLEPGYRTEIAHMVMHLGLARAYARLTNTRAIA